MGCNAPLKGWSRPGGGIAFNPKQGWQDKPLEVPCGQCMGCRVQRAQSWAIRCMHEASTTKCKCHPGKLGYHNSFLTLTYAPQNLPSSLSLELPEFQKFLKRLRKHHGRFRYFACGEYGDKSLLPHYHALIFGLDFAADRTLWKNHRGNPLFTSSSLLRLWPHGFHTIGSVSYQSAGYVARYCLKKVGDVDRNRLQRYNPATGETWEVAPEFLTMSRRPGIGSTYFDMWQSDIYPRDQVIHEGKKLRPPRYYDERLPDGEYASVKARRRARVKEALKGIKASDWAFAQDNKEANLKGKLALYSRKEV